VVSIRVELDSGRQGVLFLKKRTKKLLLYGFEAASAHRPINKSFCFFFQKEVLPS
jgi:hypothetical protein